MVMSMFNISVFWASTLRDIRSDNPEHIWNSSILESFEELEQANRQWNEDAEIAFPYQIAHYTPADHLDGKFTSVTEYHAYRGFWSGSLWNKHRGGIIILNQALLARLDAAKSSHLRGDLEPADMIELRRRATLTIQAMIRDVFASVPFSVGDIPPYYTASLNCANSTTGLPKTVGPYFLVWPLTVILRCPIASEMQRSEARAALLRIGRQFGLSFAFKSAQNYSTTEEDASPAESMELLPDFFSRDTFAE